MRFFRQGCEFTELYRAGSRYSCEFFTFLAKSSAESAAGIVLSKKVGKANKRNKLKRRLKHYFRDFWFLESKKVVVIGRKNSGFLSWQDVKNCLDEFQEKIGKSK